jgi:hypothetical protein
MRQAAPRRGRWQARAPGRLRRREQGAVRWPLAGALAAAAFALVSWWLWPDDTAAAGVAAPTPPAQQGLAAAQPPSGTPTAGSAPMRIGAPLSPLGEAQRREQLALWQGRLERAREALQGYRAAAQYPHESRPIEEHPDQVRPFAPIEEDHPLRMPGGTAPQNVRLKTTQERVFASGMESSRITITLQDLQGRTLPLRVTRAVMREVTPPGRTSSTPDFVMPANDAGVQGDAVAGDGVITAVMQPAAQGFATFAGTVRLELGLEHGGQPGFIYFDLVYSPDTAAVWLPGVREAQSAASLDFFVKAQVRLPGRYVVSARIDDAQGQPLAIALFNAEVPAGTVEFRLPVFGKLIRDKQPAFPLVLRDVEAFLLRENAFPDRVMLPRRAGTQHTSRSYPISAFSDAEWASEERTRYLTELGQDVDAAERKVQQLGP